MAEQNLPRGMNLDFDENRIAPETPMSSMTSTLTNLWPDDCSNPRGLLRKDLR
jgi:hypothetical protein